MKKIEARKYPNVKFLNDDEIQKEVIDLVAFNRSDTYWEELNYVLDSFMSMIAQARFVGGYDDMYSIPHDKIHAITRNIKTCVGHYLKGRIGSSFTSFYRGWNKLWEEDTPDPSKILELKKDIIFYKLRKKEKTLFSRKDFFHIPFEKRGIIGNNRFSISGYPCLYLGRSIYTCWEEIRQPQLAEISASAFKVEKDIKLLDLRLTPKIDSLAKECSYLYLLPYILASSIRTHNDNDVFKPEYIIPQLLLHSVIKQNAHYDYDGVIFSSTRRNVKFSDKGMDLFDNVAIPVMSNRGNSYCKTLASYFTEVEPIYFEHEFLKGNISYSPTGTSKYEDTVFHSMEKILRQKEFDKIL